MENKRTEVAVLGGGCFWCTEAVFKMLKGVVSVESGYAGGTTVNPTYQSVSTGTTGHAEVIKITYDPSEIQFRDLLTVFFASHDPTTLNRQGADTGTQYRSVVLYTTDTQEQEAANFIAELNSSSIDGSPIVTEILPLTIFYPAEKYHTNYYESHSEDQYCEIVINPKLQKVQKQFAELLKKNT